MQAIHANLAGIETLLDGLSEIVRRSEATYTEYSRVQTMIETIKGVLDETVEATREATGEEDGKHYASRAHFYISLTQDQMWMYDITSTMRFLASATDGLPADNLSVTQMRIIRALAIGMRTRAKLNREGNLIPYDEIDFTEVEDRMHAIVTENFEAFHNWEEAGLKAVE